MRMIYMFTIVIVLAFHSCINMSKISNCTLKISVIHYMSFRAQ